MLLTANSFWRRGEDKFHLTLVRETRVVARLIQIGLSKLHQIVRNGASMKLAAKDYIARRTRSAVSVETLDENVAA